MTDSQNERGEALWLSMKLWSFPKIVYQVSLKIENQKIEKKEPVSSCEGDEWLNIVISS